MRIEEFCDYYELLQVSPNADDQTVHRVFRHLAKQMHPDAPGGDAERFERLVEAFRTLKDPENRAAYDVQYRDYWARTWKVANVAPDKQQSVNDEALRARMLSLFYAQRRAHPRDPGLGEMVLVRMIECPAEFVEFQTWYLREKGWITRLESGAFAISAEGVDQVEARRGRVDPTLLISTSVGSKNAGATEASSS